MDPASHSPTLSSTYRLNTGTCWYESLLWTSGFLMAAPPPTLSLSPSTLTSPPGTQQHWADVC